MQDLYPEQKVRFAGKPINVYEKLSQIFILKCSPLLLSSAFSMTKNIGSQTIWFEAKTHNVKSDSMFDK